MSRQALWNLRPAPAPKRGGGLGKSADRMVYDRCHAAWRAGLLESWYFGKRSPNDATIIWELNGRELPDRDAVHAELERIYERAGVASVVFDRPWCGYRPVTITYVDGRRLVERFTGTAVVVDQVA